MKKYRTTLGMVAVFAGLLGCWLYLNSVQKAAENNKVFNGQPGRIIEMVVAAPDGSLKFSQQNKRWTMIKPFVHRLDQNKMVLLEDSLNNLTVLRVVEKGVRDFGKYGLDHPALTISFKTERGETRTLMIGALTTSKTNYYAREENRTEVFTLEKMMIDGFRGGPSDFRDRNVIAVNSDDIDSISIDDNRHVFRVVRDPKRRWGFVSPFKANVKSDAVRGLLETIGDLRVRDFLSGTTENLTEYGLNNPSYVLTLTSSKHKAQSVYFGKEDARKECIFVRVNGSDEVYTLSTKNFSLDRLKADSLLDVAPLSIGIGDVRAITVIDGGKTADFNRSASGPGEDIFDLGGKPLNNENFNTFYINLMALSAAGYDPGNKGTAPELSVVFKLNGERTLQADFSKRDQTSYYMTVDGKPLPYYVTAEKLVFVRKWLQRLVCGS